MNLAKEILNELEKRELTDLEKARYIYIELAHKLSFSTKFNNTDTSTYANMYNEKVDVFNLKTTEINCRMWSQLYSQLLTMINIKNEIIDLGHQYVEFYINDIKYIADATYGTYTDLARIKSNDDTEHFGYSYWQNKNTHMNDINVEKTKEYLAEIDEKINYHNNKKKSLMKLKRTLEEIKSNKIDISEIINDDTIEDNQLVSLKLEYLFSKIGVLNDSYYESKAFVYELEQILLTDDELENVSAIELKRTNNDKTVNIIQCICVKENNQYIYYLLAPNLPIKKVNKEQIISLATKGYGLQNKSIPGIIFPNKFIPGKRKINFKYEIYKLLNPKNIIDNYAEHMKK